MIDENVLGANKCQLLQTSANRRHTFVMSPPRSRVTFVSKFTGERCITSELTTNRLNSSAPFAVRHPRAFVVSSVLASLARIHGDE